MSPNEEGSAAHEPASTGSSEPPHMSPDEFRQRGHEVVDWIADYLERIEDLPVRAAVEPGWVRSRLPAHPPETGEPFATVMADLDGIIVPALTHWQHPAFFAYFPANASGPSILGDLVSSGLGVQGMLWSTSPACTELETHMLDWLVELLGLPGRFSSAGAGGGVLQDTASSAALCALVAARERAATRGWSGPLTVYTSTQAHSSIEKAVRIAGLPADGLRLVDVDEHQAMRVDELERLIAADRDAGAAPLLVAATIGTTSSTAIDPVRAIGELCRQHGVWLHVDAAYAGTAAVCPELRWINDGLEHADSYVFNPHKWMLTNFDCSAFWVADRQALVSALSILPEYLRNAASESGAVIDYRDWQIPLGRRFRALKLWFVLRHYGAEGIRAHVRRHVAAARMFAERIAEDDRFELAASAPFGLVCFRHHGGDALNERILERCNGSGALFLTHTRLDGRFTLRLAIGSPLTQPRHVDAAWRKISEIADSVGQPVSEGGRA